MRLNRGWVILGLGIAGFMGACTVVAETLTDQETASAKPERVTDASIKAAAEHANIRSSSSLISGSTPKTTPLAAASAKSAQQKPPAADSAQKKPDEKTEKTTVTGRVVSVTKRSISIELPAADPEAEKGVSNEMLLPLGKEVMVGPAPVKTVKDLQSGDLVKVGVEQTFRRNADGTKILTGTTAKVIYLVERPNPSTDASPTTNGCKDADARTNDPSCGS